MMDNMEELIALQDEKEYAAALGREEMKEPLSDQEVDVENALKILSGENR